MLSLQITWGVDETQNGIIPIRKLGIAKRLKSMHGKLRNLVTWETKLKCFENVSRLSITNENQRLSAPVFGGWSVELTKTRTDIPPYKSKKVWRAQVRHQRTFIPGRFLNNTCRFTMWDKTELEGLFKTTYCVAEHFRKAKFFGSLKNECQLVKFPSVKTFEPMAVQL